MKIKRLRIILTVLLLAVLVFIWGHSVVPEQASKAESTSVMHWLEPILAFFVGKGNVTDHFVRKLAHFAEFAVLGALTAVLCLCGRSISVKNLIAVPVFGMAAALMDETIQLFSARGSMIKDVWLDFAGVCFGGLAAALATYLIRKRKKRQ